MLSIHLESHTKIPLYEQIYQEIKKRILEKELQTGEKLPSTRGLAASLGVSRNTIDTAYYQLLAEGYIDTAPKSGFYVCDLDLSEHSLEIPSPPNPWEISARQNEEKQNRIEYDFSPFAVDLSHFPYSIWKKLSKKVLDEEKDLFLSGDPDGDLKLRTAICHYVCPSREVHCSPDQIIIGAGADYLLQMLSLLFHHMGIREITLENPCYRKAAMIFKENQMRLHTGTLDSHGLTISSIAPETEVVYVTPSHQYPLGIVMPFGRRGELLSWAMQSPKRYIIEDDHDSEFRYKGKPIPALQGMDRHNRVIYLGTFSKAVAPAIRVSYLILPPELSDAYHQALGFYSCTVSRLDQGILTRFLTEGYFEKHVNRMRKFYRNKHDLALELLKPLVQQEILQVRGEHAGLHLVLDLQKNLTEDALIAEAEQQGIRLYGIKKHYLSPTDSASESILLGYSNLSEADITEGLRRLTLVLFHLSA